MSDWFRKLVTKAIRIGGTEQLNRSALNLVAGDGVELTVQDRVVDDETRVTIRSTATGLTPTSAYTTLANPTSSSAVPVETPLSEIVAVNVASATALRAANPNIAKLAVITDIGGGQFYWDSASEDDDDGALTIEPAGWSGAGRWRRLVPDATYDVTWFGARGDGVTDDTDAIEAAIAALPSMSFFGDTTPNRPHGAAILRFGGAGGDATYRITRKIMLPQDKNLLLVGPVNHSVLIEMDSEEENYAFEVAGPNTQRVVEFHNLTFWKCGIAFQSGVRRHLAVRQCVWKDVPEWAITTLGKSVISVTVDKCAFNEGAGGINVAYEQSDIWVISQCKFVRNSGTDLRLATSGVHVIDCDFEVKPPDFHASPFVHIVNDPSGVRPGNDLIFDRCRFGNETWAPRDCVVIGPIEGTNSSVTGAIWFNDCIWKGANGGTPTETQGRTAIRASQQLGGVSIKGCTFGVYAEIIREDFAVSSGNTLTASGNVFRDNRLTADPTVALFTHGGRGWAVDFPEMGRIPGRGNAQAGRATRLRGGRNLLPRTQEIPGTSWTATNAIITKDVEGPDGLANSAWRIQRDAEGSASVRCTSSSAFPITGSATFSVWLKASTAARARVALLSTENVFFVSPVAGSVALTDEWQRFSFTAHGLDNERVVCLVYVGFPADNSDTDSEILMASPALHEGTSAMPQADNLADSTSALRAPQQWQGLMIGHSMIGYGSAPPSGGRYEVGDVVLNTAPTAGGSMGWVCVTAGEPGTWKSWGDIEV